MAADEDDLKRLVCNEEIPESTHFPAEKVTEYGSTEQSRSGQLSIGGSSSEAGPADGSHEEFIIAVFVVSFDTRKGLLENVLLYLNPFFNITMIVNCFFSLHTRSLILCINHEF